MSEQTLQIIIIAGPPGSRKSTFRGFLADALNKAAQQTLPHDQDELELERTRLRRMAHGMDDLANSAGESLGIDHPLVRNIRSVKDEVMKTDRSVFIDNEILRALKSLRANKSHVLSINLKSQDYYFLERLHQFANYASPRLAELLVVHLQPHLGGNVNAVMARNLPIDRNFIGNDKALADFKRTIEEQMEHGHAYREVGKGVNYETFRIRAYEDNGERRPIEEMVQDFFDKRKDCTPTIIVPGGALPTKPIFHADLDSRAYFLSANMLPGLNL